MGQLIVSVRDGRNRESRDLEIPDDVKIGELLDDIIQTLNGCDQNTRPGANETDLFDVRLNQMLYRGGTAESEGVWNGDILELRTRRAPAQDQGYSLAPNRWGFQSPEKDLL